ncbi:MAG: hypothetical protein GF388_05685 [Candidatus Aegiribacteria sp.]|nr:hypothetical protein [Candidatus Aegiribacteria sp.]
MHRIDIADFENQFDFMPKEYTISISQAAAVCLEEVGHSTGIDFVLTGLSNETCTIHWFQINEGMKRPWQDLEYATEHGAYAIAWHLIEYITNYKVFERSPKGGGFDFWIRDPDDEIDELNFLKNCGRMEVSGILNNAAAVKARVTQKTKQVRKGSPAETSRYVIVVEFGTPISHCESIK